MRNREQRRGREHSDRAATPVACCITSEHSIIELTYDAETRATAFAVWRDGAWTIKPEVETAAGERLVPYSPNNNLIKNGAVLLPSRPLDYGSEKQLLGDIQRYIHRYADLSPAFEQVAIAYVLLSWLYDAFNELPYLRLRGDFGTGKTRALLTIGSICCRPFFASGASTVSPIFHVLDAFRGTLVFDEADFRFSDERAEIVKILNNGNVRGLPVLRTMMNRQREFNPQAFQVFGPKLVATRSNYDDRGLESRFITEDLGTRPLRNDVPINMPEHFKDEAQEIRNKLLLFRFRQWGATKLDSSLVDPSLEPRLNQILVPLLSVIVDPKLRDQLRAASRDAQSALIAERGSLPEAHVLEVLALLLAEGDRGTLSVGSIAARVTEQFGSEYDRPITNRWVGSLLRRRLHLKTFKSHGVYVIPTTEYAKVRLLCAKYGIDLGNNAVSTVQSGDMGTSETL